MTKTTLTDPQQRLWHSVQRAAEHLPGTQGSLDQWRAFVDGVTEFDEQEGVVMWNGQTVCVDAEAPYVSHPNDDFRFACKFGDDVGYHAWAPTTETWEAPELDRSTGPDLVDDPGLDL